MCLALGVAVVCHRREADAPISQSLAVGDDPNQTSAMLFEPHQPVPELLGLTEEQAREWADRNGLQVRVLVEGGVMTLDLTNGRVNLVLVDGVVTEATIF
jgi:hypothetical protein